jgi:alpha-1,2-mannosyltransferase
VLASLLFGPAAYNLWHGQMNPVIFLLLALALRAWVRDREISCGAWLGLAASLKLAPVVLLLLFLRRRWWRGLLTAALIGAGSIAAGVLTVGLGALRTWVGDVLPVLARPDGWLYNQSWSGVVDRVAEQSVLTVQPGGQGLRVVALGLSAAGLVAAAWVVRRERDAVETRGAEFAAGLLAMLLAGTITWYAHYVSAIVALAAAAVLVARSRGAERRLLGATLAVAVAAFAVVAPLLIAQASMTQIVAASHAAGWWWLLQLCSLPALSAAMLLGALVVVLRRHPPAAPVA